jgi:VacB/RNase II family 3'-5' exoribonuclease
MSTPRSSNAKDILKRIARRVMQERGFLTDFSKAALDELEKIQVRDWGAKADKEDLRHLLWTSIDNDDSRDLDQLSVAETLSDNRVKILVAIADVDALAKKDSAINEHARQNTTSVYTAGKTFPTLPEKLSPDLTSLNYQEDRPAIVIEMTISDTGEIQSSGIYHATVRNHAKLAYNSVAAWLEVKGPAPDKAVAVDPSLAENLRVQDRVAQKLRSQRHQRGALDLQTLESRPVFTGNEIQDLRVEETNRARQLIEDFMIAANDVTARFLEGK